MIFLTGAFEVLIGGNDVTSRWEPTLKSLSVERSAGKSADTFSAVLADVDGRTVMPTAGAEVEIRLGHQQTGVGWVFSGFVTETKSKGSKGGGREISVSGSSANHNSKIKSPALRSKADASFGDVAQDWGGKAGLSVQVLGDLSGIHRKYWIQQHESFMSWGQRMSRELGATFKVIGHQAFFAPRNEGFAVSGKALTNIVGQYGENLEDWDIAPIVARPRFSNVIGRHYDLKLAKWVEKTVSVPDMNVDADMRPSIPRANPDNADQHAASVSKESQRQKGQGSATIVGDYAAEPEALFVLSGARPGADGAYRIDSLTHSLDKKSGFKTALTLRHPQNGAGTDTR